MGGASLSMSLKLLAHASFASENCAFTDDAAPSRSSFDGKRAPLSSEPTPEANSLAAALASEATSRSRGVVDLLLLRNLSRGESIGFESEGAAAGGSRGALASSPPLGRFLTGGTRTGGLSSSSELSGSPSSSSGSGAFGAIASPS